MKIIVFLKTVKFIYAQTGPDPKSNHIGPDDVVHIINPLDEMAIEEALKIKDDDKDIEVIIVSVGDKFAINGLRKSLEMGADRAVHIHCDEYDKLDSWSTAKLLAQFVKGIDFYLILCGRRSIDNNNGLVGPYVAELLNLPHISQVVEVQRDDVDDKVRVHRKVEKSNREIMECEVPALFTVEKGINAPRYPTLPMRLIAQSKKIEKLEPQDLGLPVDSLSFSSNFTEIIAFSKPKPKPRARNDQNLSAAERLKLMMKGGNSKKKEDVTIMEGISNSVFLEVERVLKESGFDFKAGD